jgi:hypothetical protein
MIKYDYFEGHSRSLQLYGKLLHEFLKLCMFALISFYIFKYDTTRLSSVKWLCKIGKDIHP